MCVCRGSQQARDGKLKWSGDSQQVKLKGHGGDYCEFPSTSTAIYFNVLNKDY